MPLCRCASVLPCALSSVTNAAPAVTGLGTRALLLLSMTLVCVRARAFEPAFVRACGGGCAVCVRGRAGGRVRASCVRGRVGACAAGAGYRVAKALGLLGRTGLPC